MRRKRHGKRDDKQNENESADERKREMEVKTNLTTMPLTVFFKSNTSPQASTFICLDRSPRATGLVTNAVGRTYLRV